MSTQRQALDIHDDDHCRGGPRHLMAGETHLCLFSTDTIRWALRHRRLPPEAPTCLWCVAGISML